MKLQFTKTNEGYVAEFEAPYAFNLHIKRETAGLLEVFQRTVPNGNYDSVDMSKYFNREHTTIDCEFSGAVYPKYIKVVSQVEVISAEVTLKPAKSGDLQLKQVTITENGTQSVVPDAEYSGLSKVVVNTDVNTLQGLDFEGVFDQEQAEAINQFYKNGIKYAEEFRKAVDGGRGTFPSFVKKNFNLLFIPKGVDLSGYTNMNQAFYDNSRLVCVAEDFNPINSINNQLLFADCTSLIKIKINSPKNTSCYSIAYNCMACEYIDLGDCGNVENWTTSFNGVWLCPTIIFRNWKFGNVPIPNSIKLSAESIHYIIQNAVDLADGATARTLTLSTPAKTNWQNSEYYAEDLAVLSTKGITIA